MSKNNETTDGSFLSVLLALKENVMFNLNVADLAIVKLGFESRPRPHL